MDVPVDPADHKTMWSTICGMVVLLVVGTACLAALVMAVAWAVGQVVQALPDGAPFSLVLDRDALRVMGPPVVGVAALGAAGVGGFRWVRRLRAGTAGGPTDPGRDVGESAGSTGTLPLPRDQRDDDDPSRVGLNGDR